MEDSLMDNHKARIQRGTSRYFFYEVYGFPIYLPKNGCVLSQQQILGLRPELTDSEIRMNEGDVETGASLLSIPLSPLPSLSLSLSLSEEFSSSPAINQFIGCGQFFKKN
ncbi:hypothetical protein RHSIM_Rhsim06G0208600 [Rhododendron simsii]|uniref:Uncharacterized protein n=1 Tax=Rhododendron simsii TaxID=118357 RepID=A0A834GTR1_RHOSS|nr:hypothetical protein RHSIM_Rhsim06G0208600 [Rhododendron simsii]